MDWLGSDIFVTWVAIAVILCVLELTAGELIFLMLGLSAFVAAGVATTGVGVEWQLVSFGVAAAVLFSMVRPTVVARLHNGPTLPSGDQGFVGSTAVVAEPVNHLEGRVSIGDVLWTARPENLGESFEIGEQVTVTSIDGVVAVVKRKEIQN